MLNSQYAGRQAMPVENANAFAHSRPRPASSATYPPVAPPDAYPSQMHYLVQPQPTHQRRSPSVNTFSTVSSGGAGGGGSAPAAYRGSPVNDAANPRRSSSGRSTSSQSSSYVALLRKQKATVWSAVSQPEDPRLAAKIRAAREQARSELKGDLTIYSAGSGGRTSTGLSSSARSKITLIRHHGKPGVVGYDPGMHLGAMKAPLRLSATEAGDEDEDFDDDMNADSAGPNSGSGSSAAAARLHHRRTGSSGRSSTGSGRRAGAAAGGYRSSGGGLAPSNSVGSGRRWSPGDTPERAGSLVEAKGGEQAVASSATASSSGNNITTNTPDDGDGGTPGSGRSSSERLDVVSDLGTMGAARLASNSLLNATKQETLNDLKRRGSVDERTVTLTTGRLFIANPD